MFQKKVANEGEKINGLSKDLAELNFIQTPSNIASNNNNNTITSKITEHSKPNKKQYVFITKPKESTESKTVTQSLLSSSSSQQQPLNNKPIPQDTKKIQQTHNTFINSTPSPLHKHNITKPSISINDSPRTQFKKTIEHNKLFIFNQVEDAKIILTKMNNIREEIKEEINSKEKLEQQILQLTLKQNQLIEANNFDEVIQVEEEINLNTEKINVINQSIQIQTETNLFLLNIEMMELLKITVDQINEQTQGMSSFIKEATEERDKLNHHDKKSIDELTVLLKTKEEETEIINKAFQSANKQVANEEAFFNKQIDDATAELTKQTKDLINQKDDIEKDILNLKEQLKLKEEALIKVTNQIEINANEKNIIESKFGIDESYAEAIERKKIQQVIYEKALNEFNSLKSQHASESKQFNNKLDALNHIIDSITHNETVNKVKNKKLLETIESMKTIIYYEKDKVNQLHINEKTIEEYSKKIIENNESIEEIDLQTKRIINDIQSFESNINNLEDVKKAHVSKKQFKDAQIVNIEIKKFIESKNSLVELVNENNGEIKRIKEEIEGQRNRADMIAKENEGIQKDIRQENQKYLKMYLEILLDFENGIIKDNDLESGLIKEEIDNIQNQIVEHLKDNPNVDSKENNKEDKGELKEIKEGEQNQKESEEKNIKEEEIIDTINKKTIEMKENKSEKIKQENVVEIPIQNEDINAKEKTTDINEEKTTDINEEKTTDINAKEKTTDINEEKTTDINEEKQATDINEEKTTDINAKEKQATDINEKKTTDINAKEKQATDINEEKTTEIIKDNQTTNSIEE